MAGWVALELNVDAGGSLQPEFGGNTNHHWITSPTFLLNVDQDEIYFFDDAMGSIPSASDTGSVWTFVQPCTFLLDFYYRIFIIPRKTIVNAARAGVDYAFDIWSAFPQTTNTLNAITPSGPGSGEVTLDIAPTAVFDILEQITVNAQLTVDAPTSVLADFLFEFTHNG
jgi:hypothetical protein